MEYTVQKVEVYRVVNERGEEIEQYDDEYGHPYPLDFASEAGAWAYVAEKESPGLHGPLTKAATERQEAIWKMYGGSILANLKARSPFMTMLDSRPIPFNNGKTIRFFS